MKKILYNMDFLKENMMGPNAVTLATELTQNFDLKQNSKILDLGCGKGLTSMYLADKYEGSQVFAYDLWITATENHQRFQECGFDNIIPIHGDALETPFADEYFDALISVDSYHYYGRDKDVMDKYIAPQVKKGGVIAFAIPGMKQEFNGGLPQELLVSWDAENLDTIRSIAWWKELLSHSKSIEVVSITEMDCFEDAWNDWLSCDNNEYAVGDRGSMNAGAGKYMNLISVICKRK